MSVRIVGADEFDALVPELAKILIDAVDSGAGVSFMAPLAGAEAEAYWWSLKPGIAEGKTVLFTAPDDGKVDGTVQLIRAWAPNQPHRCDLAKLLVHRRARRQGLGTELVKALEAEARRLGLKLITFDSVAGSHADRFYQRLGFTRVGEIPGYAYSGHGVLDATAIFYRKL